MVADGIGEEVVGEGRMRETDDLLGATKSRFALAGEEFAFLSKMAGEVARQLEDGDRTWFYKSTNAYADARLKVCVKLVAFRHGERDGAVGKEHFTCVGIDASWIGLKTRATREGMGNLHR